MGADQSNYQQQPPTGYPQQGYPTQRQQRQPGTHHRQSNRDMDMEWDTDPNARWGGRDVGEFQRSRHVVHGASLHGRMHCKAGRPLQVGARYRLDAGEYCGMIAILKKTNRIRDPQGGKEQCLALDLEFADRRGKTWTEKEYIYPDYEAGGAFVCPLHRV